MISQLQPYTSAQYFERELAAETRSEFRNGAIVPMTGGTPNHNHIVGALYIALKLALKGKPFETFVTDQRLWVPAQNLYTYPDIMVIPQPVTLQAGRTDTVMNPCLIAEVLSQSTQDYDRGEKFLAYQTLPSFCEYLLIDQYSIRVEQFIKTTAQTWQMTEYTDPAAVLSLTAVDVQIDIAALYDSVGLEKAE